MKLFIASDIHGSAYYAGLMLEQFKKSGAEQLVLLGDILYHGPRNDLPADYSPKKVAPMLNEFADKIIAVKGNCDAEVDSLMLDFAIDIPNALIGDSVHPIFLSHGHHDEPKMPRKLTYYLTGHTHIPHDYTKDGVRYLNPGSISIPKNGSPHSAIIYDNGDVKWIDIETGEEYTPKNEVNE